MKKTKSEKKDINYYLNLPYQYILIPEEGGGFYIKVKELPGCGAYGETIEEAYKNIKESMKIWFNDVINQNLEIPLPEHSKNYSGKFLLRIPKSLHKELVEKAEEEGISLNQYVLSLITRTFNITNINKEKTIKPIIKHSVTTSKTLSNRVYARKALSKKSIKKKNPEF